MKNLDAIAAITSKGGRIDPSSLPVALDPENEHRYDALLILLIDAINALAADFASYKEKHP